MERCPTCNTPLDGAARCVTCAAKAEGLTLLVRNDYANVREWMDLLADAGLGPQMDRVPPADAREKQLPRWNLYVPAEEAEEGLVSSGPLPIATGFAEALVRHDGERIGEARLRGDFIAPAFALRALEESLGGCPARYDEVGRRVDAAFRAPGAEFVPNQWNARQTQEMIAGL